ncbi:dystroglycan-like [Dorcoceras hygrometricum]|uniref:Dystroglycan-like n=1 Tax=Dorcoceras hygrometricum TaxID=472368 RepID=A0A2Z7ABQ5_9LAMI|nr:dystroglycan-like [Dorcoceras hygrometricum]
MASVFIVNSYQINFESVLMIPDHDGMINMFKALEASGLQGFLGCESVLYEKELEQFFETALVQGDDITGAISGKYFSISQARFAQIFELPTEGLVNFSEVPKDRVYDARSIFSQKGVQVEIHGKKKYMKYEFRLLNDILAKAVNVKAGSFDAVTTERFQMMTAIHFGLNVNWSKILFNVLKDMVDKSQKKAKGFAEQIGVLLKRMPAITMGDGVPFPNAKILSMKTVNTYIATNITIDARGENVEPRLAKVAVVKRTPKSKKKSSSTDETPVEVISEIAGSKKRQATEGNAPAIPKKRRTMKNKPSPSQASLDIVNVTQDVVPLQIIDPTPAAAAVNSPVPKRKSRKRRLVLPTGSDDETMGTQELFKDTDEASVKPTDEVDIIIEQVLEETLKLGVSEEEHGGQGPLRIIDPTPAAAAVNSPVPKRKSRKRRLVLPTGSDDETMGTQELVKDTDEAAVKPTDEVDIIIEQVLEETLKLGVSEEEHGGQGVDEATFADDFAQWLDDFVFRNSKPVTEEDMSIDDLLLQISNDMLLPSITATEITKIRLGESISINESDLEIDSDFEESYSDAPTVYRSPSPFLQEADSFALGPAIFSGVAQEEQLYYVESPESPPPLPQREESSSDSNVQSDLEIDSDFEESYSDAPTEQLYYVESPESPPPLPQREESSSSSWDSQMNFDSIDIPLDATTKAQTSIPAAPVYFSPLLNDLQASLSQCVDAARSDVLSRLRTIEHGLQGTLGHQNDYFRSLIQSARLEGKNNDDLQILRLNELKKTVMAQGVTTATDSLAFKSRFNALDAKLLLLDGQVAAIRSEQLEFQAKIAADLLSLSTQIGDLVDYIRGDDAKKGEGSSSRPQPTPDDQGRGGGDTGGGSGGVRTTTIVDRLSLEEVAERIREADRQRSNVDLERERNRERRERRLSRSGPLVWKRLRKEFVRQIDKEAMWILKERGIGKEEKGD